MIAKYKKSKQKEEQSLSWSLISLIIIMAT